MSIVPDVAAGVVEAPLSATMTADLRSAAATAPPLRARLLNLAAEFHDHNRAAHEAEVSGDRRALGRAITARNEVAGCIEAEQDAAADTLLSMLAFARDRRPAELAELFTPLVEWLLSALWGEVSARLSDLEQVVAAGAGRA